MYIIASHLYDNEEVFSRFALSDDLLTFLELNWFKGISDCQSLPFVKTSCVQKYSLLIIICYIILSLVYSLEMMVSVMEPIHSVLVCPDPTGLYAFCVQCIVQTTGSIL